MRRELNMILPRKIEKELSITDETKEFEYLGMKFKVQPRNTIPELQVSDIPQAIIPTNEPVFSPPFMNSMQQNFKPEFNVVCIVENDKQIIELLNAGFFIHIAKQPILINGVLSWLTAVTFDGVLIVSDSMIPELSVQSIYPSVLTYKNGFGIGSDWEFKINQTLNRHRENIHSGMNGLFYVSCGNYDAENKIFTINEDGPDIIWRTNITILNSSYVSTQDFIPIVGAEKILYQAAQYTSNKEYNDNDCEFYRGIYNRTIITKGNGFDVLLEKIK